MKSEGGLSDSDMYRIFNCGIGMVFIVDAKDENDITSSIKDLNFECYKIGKIIPKIGNQEIIFS